MPKTTGRRRTTFLVAVRAAPPCDAAADAVYAVMARGPDEAMRIVSAFTRAVREVDGRTVDNQAVAEVGIAVVGSLSSRTAKAMRLVVGEVRPV